MNQIDTLATPLPYVPMNQHARRLFHEELEHARKMSLEEKALAGESLYRYAEEITKAGIRFQHPTADEEQVLAILKARLAKCQQWESKS